MRYQGPRLRHQQRRVAYPEREQKSLDYYVDMLVEELSEMAREGASERELEHAREEYESDLGPIYTSDMLQVLVNDFAKVAYQDITDLGSEATTIADALGPAIYLAIMERVAERWQEVLDAMPEEEELWEDEDDEEYL